jgi:hypothetical protein
VETYRVAWGVTAAAVTSVAVLYDVATGGLLRLVVMALLVAAFGTLLGLLVAEGRADRWWWARRTAAWTATAAVATDAVVATGGALGLLVAAVLVVASPAAIGLASRSVLAWSSRGPSGPVTVAAERDLMRRWDRTTAEVRLDSTSADRRMLLAEERRRLLDEMQRRDPAYFDDWIVTALLGGPRDRRRFRGR